MSTWILRIASVLLWCALLTSGETCVEPEVESHTYTTTDATMTLSTAFVIEFSLTCKNGVKILNLYAEVGDKTSPATQSLEGSKYQFSWSEEHKKVYSGTYSVRFFDEEGYAALRKAQRSGEDTSAVTALFKIDIHHAGSYYGPWLQSEFVATGIAGFICYLAYKTKSKLLS